MKRRNCSKKFKIWITYKAIKDREMTSRIVSECGMYPNQIDNGNKQLQFDEEIFCQ